MNTKIFTSWRRAQLLNKKPTRLFEEVAEIPAVIADPNPLVRLIVMWSSMWRRRLAKSWLIITTTLVNRRNYVSLRWTIFLDRRLCNFLELVCVTIVNEITKLKIPKRIALPIYLFSICHQVTSLIFWHQKTLDKFSSRYVQCSTCYNKEKKQLIWVVSSYL